MADSFGDSFGMKGRAVLDNVEREDVSLIPLDEMLVALLVPQSSVLLLLFVVPNGVTAAFSDVGRGMSLVSKDDDDDNDNDEKAENDDTECDDEVDAKPPSEV